MQTGHTKGSGDDDDNEMMNFFSRKQKSPIYHNKHPPLIHEYEPDHNVKIFRCQP